MTTRGLDALVKIWTDSRVQCPTKIFVYFKHEVSAPDLASPCAPSSIALSLSSLTNEQRERRKDLGQLRASEAGYRFLKSRSGPDLHLCLARVPLLISSRLIGNRISGALGKDRASNQTLGLGGSEVGSIKPVAQKTVDKILILRSMLWNQRDRYG